MRCDTCGNGNGERRAVRKPYVAARGERIAVVTGVPVEERAACGEVWLHEHVALRLDALRSEMLDADVVAIRPYPDAEVTAA